MHRNLLVFVSLVLVSCSGPALELPEPIDRPNIVLVTLDTTRADRLGCYGYFRDTTPAIDSIAAESIVFERCLAPMATTLPSHVSLMTGVYPYEHGHLANFGQGGGKFEETETLRLIAGALQESGYQTAAFVSAAPVKASRGLAVGFDEFDEPERAERRAEETSARAVEWLENRAEGPFFLWIHYFDPHSPWNPPEPYLQRYAEDEQLDGYLEERQFREGSGHHHVGWPRIELRPANNLYDAEVRYLDDQFASVVESLRGRSDWDETIMVITGDHGEGLAQHNDMHHGNVWDEQVRVPLVIRVPGAQPQRFDGLMSLVDVMPTVLARAEIDGIDSWLQQVSGADRLSSGSDPYALSQETGADFKEGEPRYALSHQNWKLIYDPHTGLEMLFQTRRDPFELNDLRKEKSATFDRMKNELLVRIEGQQARGRTFRSGEPLATEEMDPEMLEELRSLGYVH